MSYSEKIKQARERKWGIASKFQEKENYKMSDSFNCSHCGAYHGYKMNGNEPDYSLEKKVVDHYEIPSDIEYMSNHVEYSWTEDCKCANCGELYSCHNGC